MQTNSPHSPFTEVGWLIFHTSPMRIHAICILSQAERQCSFWHLHHFPTPLTSTSAGASWHMRSFVEGKVPIDHASLPATLRQVQCNHQGFVDAGWHLPPSSGNLSLFLTDSGPVTIGSSSQIFRHAFFSVAYPAQSPCNTTWRPQVWIW